MKKRLLKNERGAALIEAAVTIPIILLISVGIFEFGRAYQTWQVLTNAAREGARVAVIEGTSDAQITAAVRGYLTIGGIPGAGTTMVSIDHNVALASSIPGAPSSGSRITVNYPFEFIVLNPVVRLITPASTAGQPLTMRAEAVMRNE
jgi:Flp pilus assembly protein TadG